MINSLMSFALDESLDEDFARNMLRREVWTLILERLLLMRRPGFEEMRRMPMPRRLATMPSMVSLILSLPTFRSRKIGSLESSASRAGGMSAQLMP
mmetsp:Transcript_141471/g.352718  ORF Transcript_141471/g.352718 Transcript_141471/m.352718 type:complete len:96 (+) Transcript_141471:387-674(+)